MMTNENMREIPPPPSGGSWTFDETKWSWVSNDPAPTAEQGPSVEQASTHNEHEQE